MNPMYLFQPADVPLRGVSPANFPLCRQRPGHPLGWASSSSASYPYREGVFLLDQAAGQFSARGNWKLALDPAPAGSLVKATMDLAMAEGVSSFVAMGPVRLLRRAQTSSYGGLEADAGGRLRCVTHCNRWHADDPYTGTRCTEILIPVKRESRMALGNSLFSGG